MKYIRHYNNVPKTLKWRYFDPTRRITPGSAQGARSSDPSVDNSPCQAHLK
jgi:hypothetical protein